MNYGTIPEEQAIRECREIYERMKRHADKRSMVHRPLLYFVSSYQHGRSYQGYFRDMLTLMHCGDDESWTLDKDQVIDEQWVRQARRKRSAHRQNAVAMKVLKRKRKGKKDGA